MSQTDNRAPAQQHPGTAPHPLDNPAWAALTGGQAHLAVRRGQAARYLPDLAPFAALPDSPTAAAWADLAALSGPERPVVLPVAPTHLPPDWVLVVQIDGVQFVDAADPPADEPPDPEAEPLGPADVPEMLDLVARTQPGPFLPRTVELGGYLGIRRRGTLVAMAGERMRPPGWTEISAVCTDPAYRGQGLASRLIQAVAAGIRARGDTPFLHAEITNTTAIRRYQALGFTHRRDVLFLLAHPAATTHR